MKKRLASCGPPFVITDEEMAEAVEKTHAAIVAGASPART